ncbi:hypothetical protein BBP40_000779 [Aspergillus hancockii]|nr:hypothetical protein BBP40_000779 [Aspergillus hancockii]
MSSSRSWIGRVFIATSLDGYIARTDGDINWLTNPPSDPNHQHVSSPRTVDNVDQYMARVDCMLMGRKTYEKCLAFAEWPYPTKRTFVLSTTLSPGMRQRPSVKVEVLPSLDEVADMFERERIRSVMTLIGVDVIEDGMVSAHYRVSSSMDGV